MNEINDITEDKIIKRAEELYKEWGQVPIYKLIKELDNGCIEIVYSDDLRNTTISGDINYNDENKKFLIRINPSDVGKRQRFTAGHELGHYVLHRDKIREQATMQRGGAEYDFQEEQLADSFAGKVLMPQTCVERYINKKYEDIQPEKALQDKDRIKKMVEDVADEFAVSFVAAIVRLRELRYYIPYLE